MSETDQEALVQAVIAAGVRDARVLQALREVPRAAFVPAHLAEQAYLDEAFPIPHGQFTTQPSLVARMIESLGLTGSETVLEVGAGYGFQTALLARLARFVWSIERWPDLADTARANLAGQGITNVVVVVGDGSEGCWHMRRSRRFSSLRRSRRLRRRSKSSWFQGDAWFSPSGREAMTWSSCLSVVHRG